MNILLTNNLDIDLFPVDEITLGINYLRGDGYPVNEEGETDFNADPIFVNKFTIGLLFLSLNIVWND